MQEITHAKGSQGKYKSMEKSLVELNGMRFKSEMIANLTVGLGLLCRVGEGAVHACLGSPEGFSAGSSTPAFGCWASFEASLTVLCWIGGQARRGPVAPGPRC